MQKNIEIEKTHKNFMNFKKEEAWLQKKLEAGWMLDRYSREFEEGTYYTFKEIQKHEQKAWIFKIDFREFDEEEEYFDYIEVFKESGWSTLSKPGYAKHIFYTKANNQNQDIFSDADSRLEREKRVMHDASKNGMIYLGFLITSMILYLINHSVFFASSAFFSGIATIRYLIRYFKHKKTLKSTHS